VSFYENDHDRGRLHMIYIAFMIAYTTLGLFVI